MAGNDEAGAAEESTPFAMPELKMPELKMPEMTMPEMPFTFEDFSEKVVSNLSPVEQVFCLPLYSCVQV